MTGECLTVKFPEHAQPVEREPETDEEIIRRQPVRAMLRRMGRNHLKLVPTWDAMTPFGVLEEWADSLSSTPKTEDLDDLAGRLRGARLMFDEDAVLAGQHIVDALMEQGGLLKDWGQRARLRTLTGQLQWLLSELGLL